MDTEGTPFAFRPRVRIAGLIALAAGLLFAPLELHYASAETFPWLAFIYAFHLAVAITVLVGSYTTAGEDHGDALALLLVVGHDLNLHLYLVVAPYYPALTVCALICLLIGATVLFAWSPRRVLVLSLATCTGFAVVGAQVMSAAAPGARFGLAFGALVVGAAIALASARVLERLRTGLARRQSDLAALSARLMSAQEEERRKLSRELHDEFGQSLTAVNAHLWLIERHPPADAAGLSARTAEARALVSRTLSAMRELSQLLRPAVLDQFGLVPSLDDHLKAFAERHRIAVSFSADGLPDRLPPEVETALYRITQEALTNVARHAQAKRVRVALAAREGELRLDVEDDGVGFPARGAGTRPGTGLIGIRERVRALGGTVVFQSGKGARLRVRVPMLAEHHEAARSARG
jgi:signal transduction histidine kinase